jgi:hypothetical protein
MNGKRLRLNLVLAAALAALTIVVYAPVSDFMFVNYDDNVYVSENARVAAGLNAENVAWSMTSFVNANWHPLTVLSHMLDVEISGLDPTGHHVTNLVLHVVNVGLLFWLFASTTRTVACRLRRRPVRRAPAERRPWRGCREASEHRVLALAPLPTSLPADLTRRRYLLISGSRRWRWRQADE